MSIDNTRKNPNCCNGEDGANIADLLYILDYNRKHRCHHHHCSDSTDNTSNSNVSNCHCNSSDSSDFEEIDIEPIGCFDTLGYTICCNEDGCCYRVRNDERNCYWPEFARPRWLSCQELYQGNTNSAHCGCDNDNDSSCNSGCRSNSNSGCR